MSEFGLEDVRNVRDLGGIKVSGGKAVRPGLFFRGSALDKPSLKDQETLKTRMGIKHVIDLRVTWELKNKPDMILPFASYEHIPLFDKEIAGIDYVKPLPGTIMIGHDFACDSHDFYKTMANPLTAKQLSLALKKSFNYTMNGEPVYIHCSGGKDRAGITALLILHILGASEEDILTDYLLTNESRDTHIEHVYKRFLRLCRGDEEFARMVTDAHRALPGNITAFYTEIDKLYGGIDNYVQDQLGITPELQAEYRRICTE